MFPANDDGQENGLNDPGIETFKDHPLTSLAREGLQNSSDAADNSGKPVEVHFQKLEIPSSEFPGCADFKKTLQACIAFSKSSKQTVQFFESTLEVLSQEKLNILRIADFNTTGLIVGEKDDRSTDWFSWILPIISYESLLLAHALPCPGSCSELVVKHFWKVWSGDDYGGWLRGERPIPGRPNRHFFQRHVADLSRIG